MVVKRAAVSPRRRGIVSCGCHIAARAMGQLVRSSDSSSRTRRWRDLLPVRNQVMGRLIRPNLAGWPITYRTDYEFYGLMQRERLDPGLPDGKVY